MQYLLRKNDYPFLRYDSFLGANELQTRLVNALAESMISGLTSIVRRLTNEDLTAVLDACRNCDLFSAKEKRQYFSDFVNAPPKLRFAVGKVKKWLYGKVLLCQEESFCKERTVFG